MVRFVLFLLRLLRYPVKWMGANYEQFEAMLIIKLKMDFRRTPLMYQSNGNGKYKFGVQLLVYVLLGLFLLIGFYEMEDFLLLYTTFFSVLMLLVGTTLISEFTSVLFDQSENQILLPRPISDRTLLLVRLVHIQVYLLMIGVALSFGTLLLTVFRYGLLNVLAMVPVIVCASWITLLLATFLYILLSKLVSAERFKDLINYFQIFMAIIIFGGFQILPHIEEVDGLGAIQLTMEWWSYLFPPIWLAGLFRFFTQEREATDGLLALLSVVISFGGAWLMIRYLAKGFDHVIAAGSAAGDKRDKNVSEPDSKGFWQVLKNEICVSQLEKAGWMMAMAAARRDRKFKQAVYPSFGIVLVMVIILLKPSFNDWQGFIHELGQSKKYLTFVFASIFGLTAITQLSYTDTPEAGWIYKALPGKSLGHLQTGAVKAMIVTFYVPICLILLMPVIYIWGFEVVPMVVCGFLMSLFTFNLGNLLFKQKLPFTLARDLQSGGDNVGKAILSFLLIGVVIGILFLFSLLSDWVTWLTCIVMVIAIRYLFKRMRKVAIA